MTSETQQALLTFSGDTSLRPKLSPRPKVSLPPEVLQVGSYGDLVLSIGSTGNAKLVKVDSYLLKSASPVFGVLLGPDFKEGQSTHDLANPLSLPDDDPQAMTNMLHLIHFQPQNIDFSVWQSLQKLVVACDKYGCAKNYAGSFISEIVLSRGKYGDTDIVFIAMMIGDHKLFLQAIEKVVRMPRKSFDSACSPMLRVHMPNESLDLFAQYRQNVWNVYQRYAHIFPRQLLQKAESNKGIGVWYLLNQVVTWYWTVLYSNKVLPEDPVADLIELSDMHEVVRTQIMAKLPEVELNFSTRLSSYTELLAYTEQTLERTLAQMNRGKAGDIKLCFVCVRSSQQQSALPCPDHDNGASATLSSVTGFGSSPAFGSSAAFGSSTTGFGQVFTGTTGNNSPGCLS